MTIEETLYGPIRQSAQADIVGLTTSPQIQVDNINLNFRDTTRRTRRLLIPIFQVEQSRLPAEYSIWAAARAAGFDLRQPWRQYVDHPLGCIVLEQAA